MALIANNNKKQDRSSEVIKYSQKKENYKEVVEEFFNNIRVNNRGYYWRREDLEISYDLSKEKFVLSKNAPLLNSILTSKIEFNRVKTKKVLASYEYLIKNTGSNNTYNNHFDVMLDYVYTSLKKKIKDTMKKYNHSILANEYPPNYEMILDDFHSDKWMDIWKMYLRNNMEYASSRERDITETTISLINNDRLFLYKNVDDLLKILILFKQRIYKGDFTSRLLNNSLNKLIDEYYKYGNEVLKSLEKVLEFYISNARLRNSKGDLPKTINKIRDIAINSDYVFKPSNLSIFNINNLLYKTDLESFLRYENDQFADVDLYITIDDTLSADVMFKLLSGLFINKMNKTDIMLEYYFPNEYGNNKRTTIYNLSQLNVRFSTDLYRHSELFIKNIIALYGEDEKQLLLHKLSLIKSLTNDLDENKYDAIKNPCKKQ